MSYELWLSIRYLLARRRERFISLIAVLSIGGVALGVMALLVVLSVMSGFDYDLKEKLVGANAHLTVQAPRGIPDAEPLIRTIAAAEHVAGVSPFVVGQAIVRLPDRAFGVVVRGLDVQREIRVSRLQDYLVLGRLPREDREAVLGVELARELGVGLGDPLALISPADGSMHQCTVSGLFRSGMYELDASLAGVTLAKAQKLFGLPGTVTGIAIRLDQLERADDVKARLAVQLGGRYVVKTWMELNQTLFDALKLEKLTMFVILTLIVLVAAVNIVSTLIMMVIEKTRDIGILKAIGASNGSVGRIFTWEGLVIGGLGTLAGLLGAWGLIWLQDTYHLVALPNTIYYLDHLPVRIEWTDWGVTVAAAIAISWLATVYPARQAARLTPVEALRYE
jgi:lipoprotein-releasing system permease protein